MIRKFRQEGCTASLAKLLTESTAGGHVHMLQYSLAVAMPVDSWLLTWGDSAQ